MRLFSVYRPFSRPAVPHPQLIPIRRTLSLSAFPRAAWRLIPPETSARIVLPPTEPVVIEEDDSAPLLDRVNNCIYLYEYGKAVKLMEDNPEESSDPSFDDAKNELLVHFTRSAKNYYTAAATYITKQEVMGYDFSTGFEGYSAEDSSLDPNVLSELVSDEDKVVINRTHIECSTDYSFKVTVTFCGMTAVYPAEDITLE